MPWPELLVGVVAIFVYEALRWATHRTTRWYKARDALERLLRTDGAVLVARSVVIAADGRSFVRDSDVEVENMLPLPNRGRLQHEAADLSLSDPTRHLIVIGSTRYNATAHAIQRHFALPYQFVWVTANSESGTRDLAVVTEYGDELRCTTRHVDRTDTERVDYGILFVARLNNDKRLMWIAGIHGAGTVAVASFLAGHAAVVNAALPARSDVGVAWLIRARARLDAAGEVAEALMPEVLGSAREVSARGKAEARALISDFGNVVMAFDRSRTYRAIGRALGRDPGAVKNTIEDSHLREHYERGELDTDQFVRELRHVLKGNESSLSRKLVEKAWSDIFSERPEMQTVLKSLHDRGVPLVLLSNTNPLHFEAAERDYHDVLGLFDEKILSYKERKAKPDTALFEEALAAVRRRGVTDVEKILYVDDDNSYVEAAKQLGMNGHTYTSYPQFAVWLRLHGLYFE